MNIPPLSGSLVEFFELLLQSSLRGTLMVGGVLALQAAMGARLSPRWRYALWLAVAAALLLPPMTRPAIDVTPLSEMPVVRYVITPEEAEVHVPESVPSVGAPAKLATPLTWMEIAAAIWFSGVVVIAATWLLAHCLMMRRFRRDAFTLNAELLREIEQCADAIGLRRIPNVLQAPAIPSPAVTGFLRGTLLLPADVQTRFTPAERRFMLLHELAHLRRGDLVTNWLINALLALHWFNPVLWFAAARVRADRESACDATVLHHAGADERSAYGHTLLKLHTAIEMPHRSPAFVGILERGGAIHQRIQHIASYGSGKKVWAAVAGIAAAGLLSCIGVRLYAQPPVPAKPALERQISTLEKRLLARSLNAQQVELESRVFTIDPSVGKISVGALTLTPPPEREDLPVGPTVGLMQQDELDQLIEKLSSLKGVQSLSTPRVTARHAQRAVLEITKTLRYASKWNVNGGGAAPEATDFETKSVGLTLETETGVALQAKGERTVLDLNVTPQLVYFGGWKDAELAVEGTVEKPVFIENRKITTSLSIYDGQHVLLWWYMDLPDGVPWNYDPHLKATDLKTTRRTLLWVLSPRLLEARAHVEREAFPAEYFQPRNWETKDASVEQLLMHFKEQSRAIDPQKRGLNLVFAKPAKEPPLVSLDLKGVSLIGALEHAFKAAGMRVEEQGDNTLVITEEPR